MNPMLTQLKAVARSYVHRLIRKIKHLSRSLYQRLKPVAIPAPLSSQANAFYCSAFPSKALTPNALTLPDTTATQAHSDAFWFRLTGHAKGHYSLAIVNRSLAVALFRHTRQACFVPFDDGFKKTVQQMPDNTDPYLKEAIRLSIPASPARPIVSIVHHYPVITDDDFADIRLIIFFWEESSIPAETISILNQKFDALLVATSFVATVLRNSGCATPIFVIPLGVDHLVDYAAPYSPLPSMETNECFRFLHVSSVFDRKGPEFLLAAFIAQFDADDAVELYIKTFPNPHNRIHAQLAHYAATKPNPPRVIIDEAEVSNEVLQALYQSAHTLVLPTRGEGFNLPAAEALALGLPLIVTGFGAHTDFCTTETAKLIPFCFDLSQSHLNTGDSCWMTPDIRALSTLMQESIDEIRSGAVNLEQRRSAGHALMRSTYTWDQAVHGINRALHWLLAHPPLTQDITIKRITYASLMDVSADEDVYSDADSKKDANHNADALIITLDSTHIDTESASWRLNSLPSKGLVSILELPEGFASVFAYNLSVQHQESIRSYLNMFDRIIVPNVEDLNQMLPFGLLSRLMLLPRHPDHGPFDSARETRLKNMIRGLQYDRLLTSQHTQA